MRIAAKLAVSSVISVMWLTLAPSDASADGLLTYANGAVRLQGGASWGKNRSLWARRRSLVLVMPGQEIMSETIKINKTTDSVIREIRLTAHGNRTELELRLAGSAIDLLSSIQVREEGADLVVQLSAPPAGPAGLQFAAPDEASESPASPATPPGGKSEPVPSSGPQPSTSASAAAVIPSGPRLPGPGRLAGKPDLLQGPKVGSPGPSSIWILMILAGIGGGAAWWLRRRRQRMPLAETHIDIVAQRPLSGKHRLVLVESGGELLLLGCTEKEIRLLRAVDRQKLQQSEETEFFDEGARMDTINLAAQENDSQAPQPSRFVAQLNQQIQQRRARQVVEQNPSPQPQPLDEQWAEGILKLRRARRSNGESSQGMLH